MPDDKMWLLVGFLSGFVLYSYSAKICAMGSPTIIEKEPRLEDISGIDTYSLSRARHNGFM